jgi:ATP-dependent Clp protease ATP-binding subunit ClpA
MSEGHTMFFDARFFSDPIYQSLAQNRCTTKVIDVLLQVFQRATDETRLLNHPFTVSMTLLTILRSEINVAQTALNRMGVDLGRLDRRLAGLLHECDEVVFRSPEQVSEDVAHSYQEASATIWDLLERAKQEAAILRNDWVGTEHLLLAIICMADASLLAILSEANISYKLAIHAIRKALQA